MDELYARRLVRPKLLLPKQTIIVRFVQSVGPPRGDAVLTPAGIAAVIEHHFNHRDLHALEALWDEDIHFEGPGVAFTGREGMAAQERNLWRAFPDVASEARTF